MNPKCSTPHTPARLRASSARTLCALALIALACAAAQAQDEAPARRQNLEDGEPPPMRFIPQDVRSKLSTARDDKERTRVCIELADERLTNAASYADAGRFEKATAELGVYEAIVKDSISHLQQGISGRVSNKKRDLFKRLEMTFRSHLTRIETIRRTLPAHYVGNFLNTLDFVRGARSEALNAFYSDTVLREDEDRGSRAAEGERAGSAAAAQPDKKPQQ
ncbi:MAG TPA: hypothetical protein VGX48_26070 [Pyrinomonadaceae bacterium]|jgi:hypothetical protein|nr:hypothetical protein [Pyrinomonadaceae bacterium]